MFVNITQFYLQGEVSHSDYYCAGVLEGSVAVDVLVFFLEALAAAAAEVLVLRPGLFLPRRCTTPVLVRTESDRASSTYRGDLGEQHLFEGCDLFDLLLGLTLLVHLGHGQLGESLVAAGIEGELFAQLLLQLLELQQYLIVLADLHGGSGGLCGHDGGTRGWGLRGCGE